MRWWCVALCAVGADAVVVCGPVRCWRCVSDRLRPVYGCGPWRVLALSLPTNEWVESVWRLALSFGAASCVAVARRCVWFRISVLDLLRRVYVRRVHGYGERYGYGEREHNIWGRARW